MSFLARTMITAFVLGCGIAGGISLFIASLDPDMKWQIFLMRTIGASVPTGCIFAIIGCIVFSVSNSTSCYVSNIVDREAQLSYERDGETQLITLPIHLFDRKPRVGERVEINVITLGMDRHGRNLYYKSENHY